MAWKVDVGTRQDIARSVWNLFIHNIEKVKIHYGKKVIFIVVQLDEDIDAEGTTEANMVSKHHDGYSELHNIPMRRDG